MAIKKEYYLYLSLIIAWFSMAGSLFFSEVLKYPPCILCWYQRIFMYPLVVIFLVALIKKTHDFYLYALPLSVFGWLIAVYHNLLYYKILPESNAPCLLGVSCTTKFIEWFGFITIPLLSLVAYSVIIFCLLSYKKACRNISP